MTTCAAKKYKREKLKIRKKQNKRKKIIKNQRSSKKAGHVKSHKIIFDDGSIGLSCAVYAFCLWLPAIRQSRTSSSFCCSSFLVFASASSFSFSSPSFLGLPHHPFPLYTSRNFPNKTIRQPEEECYFWRLIFARMPQTLVRAVLTQLKENGATDIFLFPTVYLFKILFIQLSYYFLQYISFRALRRPRFSASSFFHSLSIYSSLPLISYIHFKPKKELREREKK